MSVGSTLPEQREVDADTIARADVLVADEVGEVLRDTGGLIAARAAGAGLVNRVAVAGMCVRAALDKGLGTRAAIPVEVVLK